MTPYDWGTLLPPLFPLAALVPLLKGFCPPNLSGWFRVLPTIFGELAYLSLLWHFETVEFYWSPLWVGFTGAVALSLYVLRHLSLKGSYAQLGGRRYAFNVTGLLVVYTVFVVCMTYAFNVLERLRWYEVLRGEIVIATETGEQPAGDAKIVFHFYGADDETTQADAQGRYLKKLPKTKRARLNAVRIHWWSGQTRYGLTIARDELSHQYQRWKLMRQSGAE